MTLHSLGQLYIELGTRLQAMKQATVGDSRKPMLSADSAVGGAAVLCYVRDLLTNTPRDQFNRDELLVLLERISADQDIFPLGVGVMMWDVDDE